MACPTNRIRRRIALFGILGVLVPSVAACIQPNPEWYRDGIVMASVASSIVIVVGWAASAMIGAECEGARMQWFLTIVLSAAVGVSCLYVNGAHILGGRAKFDTWHLLGLFAIIDAVLATSVVAVLVGLWLGIDSYVEALFRPKPSDPK